MPSLFRTRLRLEEVECREVPSAPDPTGSSALLADDPSQMAASAQYVTIDFARAVRPASGWIDITKAQITVHLQDGTSDQVTVTYASGTTGTAAATITANALIADGYNATANGMIVTIWGRNGVEVEAVYYTVTEWRVFTTPQLPVTTGYNGATGSSNYVQS